MKFILAILIVVSALVVIVFNFSEITRPLVCTGEIAQQDSAPQAETAFVEFTEYRWWVGLWSDSSGNVVAQFDQTLVQYLALHVEKIGDGSLTLYTFRQMAGGEMIGGLREANSEITLRVYPDTVFTGRCEPRA